MNIFQRIGKVKVAQARMAIARHELSVPAAALLARGRAHPLTTAGTAAGAGFVLGRLNVHPLRIPGLGSLLGGGLAEAVAYGTKLVAELGPTLFAAERAADRRHGSEDLRADDLRADSHLS